MKTTTTIVLALLAAVLLIPACESYVAFIAVATPIIAVVCARIIAHSEANTTRTIARW